MVFNHAELVANVREVFKHMEPLLGEDRFDYENLRLFSGTALNGADETVVFVPLTRESPTYLKMLQSEEEAPLADMAPMPVCGFLPLDPCDCFSVLQNGIPYLVRALTYHRAEMVDANGNYVRDTTEYEWQRGQQEPEWYKFLGNAACHCPGCSRITVNQQ